MNTLPCFLPGQVERLVLNGEPVIRRSPAGVLYFAREYRLPDGAVAREFVSLARDGSTAPLFDAAKLCSLLGLEPAVSSPSPTANSATPA